MKKLAILGASGHGKVVADIAESCGWSVAFFDDGKVAGTLNLVWPILGGYRDLVARLDDFTGVIVAIGNNAVRLELGRSLRDRGGRLVSLIHPAASVSQYAQIGDGTVIMPGAVVNAAAKVGALCVINTSASVDHDCVLGDGVHVSPGAHLAGEVQLGEGCWVGIGAVVRQQIRVGANAMIAAGAVVIRDVEDNARVAGVPAIWMR